MGLGSTGATAARFGGSGIGNEAGYLKVTGALGLFGLVIYLGWFLGIMAFSVAALRFNDGPWKGLAILTLSIAVGFLLNNLTAHPHQPLSLGYLFRWLPGLP